MTQRVWITGIGIISALGKGLEAHAAALRNSRSGLSHVNFFDGQPPDPCLCGIVPFAEFPYTIEQSVPNRANLLLETAIVDAMHSAGLDSPLSADIIAGTTLGNMNGWTSYYKNLKLLKTHDFSLVKYFLPGDPVSYCAEKFGFQGKALTVASACGSATAALGRAFHLVRNGVRSCVFSGGFEALCPFVVAGFHSLQLVSKTECRPFDRNREGLNPGEAAVIFVVESERAATQRGVKPFAEIAGFGDGLDAYHFSAAHPEGAGLVIAMTKALDTARLPSSAVDHLHLHGTATQINDNSEYRALKTVFGNRLHEIPACSTKPMTGHTFGASGGLNAAFSVLSLTDNILPATLFHSECDPACEGLQLLLQPRFTNDIDSVVSTSLGFGGEAFALIIRRAGGQG